MRSRILSNVRIFNLFATFQSRVLPVGEVLNEGWRVGSTAKRYEDFGNLCPTSKQRVIVFIICRACGTDVRLSGCSISENVPHRVGIQQQVKAVSILSIQCQRLTKRKKHPAIYRQHRVINGPNNGSCNEEAERRLPRSRIASSGKLTGFVKNVRIAIDLVLHLLDL